MPHAVAGKVRNPITGSLRWNDVGDVYSFIGTLLNIALELAGVFAIVLLVYAGFLYITSSGEPEKVQKATGTLTWTIVGIIVMFAAKIIIQFVADNLG